MDVKAASLQGLDEFILRALKTIRSYMLNALVKLGEECVSKVRDRSASESWIDRTGNLRSSIGYAVYEYGLNYMNSSFPVILNGSTGHSEGMRIIQELAQEYSNVFALVVIAGMDYADEVEALDSKDVLESTRIWASSIISEKLNRAKEEAFKEINSWKL